MMNDYTEDVTNSMIEKMDRSLNSAESTKDLSSYERTMGMFKMISLFGDELEDYQAEKLEEVRDRLEVLVYEIR